MLDEANVKVVVQLVLFVYKEVVLLINGNIGMLVVTLAEIWALIAALVLAVNGLVHRLLKT